MSGCNLFESFERRVLLSGVSELESSYASGQMSTLNVPLQQSVGITLTVTQVIYNGPRAKLQVQLASDDALSGTVRFYRHDELIGTVAVGEGSTASFECVGAGEYAFRAEYSGDDTHAPAVSSVVNAVVSKSPLGPANVWRADDGSYVIDYSDRELIPTGTIYFMLGPAATEQTIFASSPLVNGIAVLNELPQDTFPYVAYAYSGDHNYVANLSRIGMLPIPSGDEGTQENQSVANPLAVASTVSLEVLNEVSPTTNVTVLKATVSAPGATIDQIYGGLLRLLDDGGNEIGQATRVDDNGVAYFVLTDLDAGTLRVQVDYAGGADVSPATSDFIDVNIVAAGPGDAVTADGKVDSLSNSARYPATVTLLLHEPGKPVPTGQVLILGSRQGPQWVEIDAMGRVALENWDPGHVGQVSTVSWAYAGDANYAPAGGNLSLQQQYPGSQGYAGIYVTATAIPGNPDGVRLTVMVKPKAGSTPTDDPTGLVQVRDGDTVLGNGYLDATGQVVIDLATAPADVSALTVTYAGNVVYHEASTSPVVKTISFVADVNGNSTADQIIYNRNARTVWFAMDGGSTVVPLSANAAGEGWRLAGVADFDGDGYADLLWTNDQLRKQSVWRLQGRFVAGFSMLNHAPKDSAWVIESVEDADGDGDADLLWRNTKTNGAYVWLLQGTTVVGGGFPA